MKIGVILPTNIWFAPYLDIYNSFLDKENIDYEVISWNRDGSEKPSSLAFQEKCQTSSRFKKLFKMFAYFRFARKKISENQYDKLIIFGSISGIFLLPTLFKYKKKYIIDFRDLSIEQNQLLRSVYKISLKRSYSNVISSPGFKKFLPKVPYFISHNFKIDLVEKAILNKPTIDLSQNPINILTIGGIRDFSSNVEIVDSLANNNDYNVHFVGKGLASLKLQEHVESEKIKNVFFKGYYEKEEEELYINECTLLNIYYPKTNLHSSALSNRFYNSLIYCKPMIVTSNSTQGDLVDEYQLGISIIDTNNLGEQIKMYLSNFNREDYIKNRNSLLRTYIAEYYKFEKMLLSFFTV